MHESTDSASCWFITSWSHRTAVAIATASALLTWGYKLWVGNKRQIHIELEEIQGKQTSKIAPPPRQLQSLIDYESATREKRGGDHAQCCSLSLRTRCCTGSWSAVTLWFANNPWRKIWQVTFTSFVQVEVTSCTLLWTVPKCTILIRGEGGIHTTFLRFCLDRPLMPGLQIPSMSLGHFIDGLSWDHPSANFSLFLGA